MFRLINIIVVFVLAAGIFAQSQSSIDELEKMADDRSREIMQSWTPEHMPEALNALTELYNTPGMSKTKYAWKTILYNLTCAHSLLGQADSAIMYLGQAISAGYSDYKHMLADTDLDPLRPDGRFQALLNQARKKTEFWNGPLFSKSYSESLSVEEKLAGLAELWLEIKLNFVFFDQVPDLDWDSLYAAYIPEVMQAGSTLEYFRVMQKLCALLKDGHTGLTPPRELWPALWGSPPVSTMLIDDAVLITKITNDSLDLQKIHPGMEIIAIDGIPVKEYAERLVRPYMCASTPQGLEAQTYTYYLLNGPEDQPVGLTLRDADGDVTEFTVSRQSASWSAPLFEFRELEGDIAYFNIRTFSNDSVVAVFDSLFDTIDSSKGLIIDLRKNGGGNSGIGWRILGYLTDSSFATLNSKYRIYSPQERYMGSGEIWEETIYEFPAHGAKLYSGPVAVLASRFTGSAAEDFLVAFDLMDRGPIIGEPSYGSTGQPLSFSLPGGISGRVCFKRCSYPDGTEFVGVGVQPDIVINTTISDIREDRDPVLEAAVDYIQDHKSAD